MGKPNPALFRERQKQGASAIPTANELTFAKDDLDEAGPSRTSGKHYSYEEMVALVDRDIHLAIAVAQTQLQKADVSVRDELYSSTMTCLAYKRLIESDVEWERCCSDPFWENQVPDRGDPLLVAFKYVRRTLRGPNYERTRFHAKAMRGADRAGIELADVKAYIQKNRGFRKLHDIELARERAEQIGDPTSEDVDNEIDVSPENLPEDPLQMEAASAAESSDTTSDEGSDSIPPVQPRQKKYAEPIKDRFAVEVILPMNDGLAATNRARVGEFVIRCRIVDNGSLEWVRIDGELE